MHSYSILKQNFKLSLYNIKSNKMRSFLTVLGIVIGVMAVVTIMTIMNCYLNNQISEFELGGLKQMNISLRGGGTKSGLEIDDMVELGNIDHVTGWSPDVSIYDKTVFSDTAKVEHCEVVGRNYYYYINCPDRFLYGRPMYECDINNRSYVCVLDRFAARLLFPGEYPVGKIVKIDNVDYQVIGICKLQDDWYFKHPEWRYNNGTIYIPYTLANTIYGYEGTTSAVLYVDDVNNIDSVQKSAEDMLYQMTNHKKSAYSVQSNRENIQMLHNQMAAISGVSGGVAAIALLVGGIGIMNMMLVSVTERTREIGLRKAMGATPAKIQVLFLMEAVILSLFGGILGCMTGFLLSFAIVKGIMKIMFTLSLTPFVIAFCFSTGIGIVFGWAPAKKASQLSPIDALRSE